MTTVIAETIEDKHEIERQALSQIEQIEMQKILQSSETPLNAYARHLARLELVNPKLADWLRIKYPVTRLFKAEIIYRKKTWKDFKIQIIGQTGSGKSLSAMTLARWIDPDWNIDKLFWDYHELLDYVRTEAKSGDCLVLDEDPRFFGLGSLTLNYAIQNIECTLRYRQINFIFVYVYERSHKVHTVLYTRGEHFKNPPYADYFVLGVLQPIMDTHQLLGLMTVPVPPQKLISQYDKKKQEFVEVMQRSAGFGAERDIVREYAWVLRKLADDKVFLSLPTKAQKINYVSYKYRLPKGLVDLLLGMVEVEDEEAPEIET